MYTSGQVGSFPHLGRRLRCQEFDTLAPAQVFKTEHVGSVVVRASRAKPDRSGYFVAGLLRRWQHFHHLTPTRRTYPCRKCDRNQGQRRQLFCRGFGLCPRELWKHCPHSRLVGWPFRLPLAASSPAPALPPPALRLRRLLCRGFCPWTLRKHFRRVQRRNPIKEGRPARGHRGARHRGRGGFLYAGGREKAPLPATPVVVKKA